MLNCLILAAISKSDRQKISEELNQTIKQEELQESEPKSRPLNNLIILK